VEFTAKVYAVINDSVRNRNKNSAVAKYKCKCLLVCVVSST
jgi:hypothetical protein